MSSMTSVTESYNSRLEDDRTVTENVTSTIEYLTTFVSASLENATISIVNLTTAASDGDDIEDW